MMNIQRYNQAKDYLRALTDTENQPTISMLSDIAHFSEFNLGNFTPENLHLNLQNILIEKCRIYIIATIVHTKTYLEQSLIADDIGLLIDAGLNKSDSDSFEYMVGEQDKAIIAQQSKLIYGMTFAQREEYLQLADNFGVLQDLAKHVQMKVTSSADNILQQINSPDYIAKHEYNLRQMRESGNSRDYNYSRRVEVCNGCQMRMFQDYIRAVDAVIRCDDLSDTKKTEQLSGQLQQQYAVIRAAIESGNAQIYIDYLMLCFDYMLTNCINFSIKLSLELQATNYKFITGQQLDHGLMFVMRSLDGTYVYNRIFMAMHAIMSASVLLSSPGFNHATSKSKMHMIEQLDKHYSNVMAAFNNVLMQPNILQQPLVFQQIMLAQICFHELMLFYTFAFIKHDLSNDDQKDLETKINALYKFIYLSDEKICTTILRLVSILRSYLIPTFSLNQLAAELDHIEMKIKQTMNYKGGLSTDIRRAQNIPNILINAQQGRKQTLLFYHFNKDFGKTLDECAKYSKNACTQRSSLGM